jgi:uncharacterized protein (TIGR03435 family)
MTWQILTCALLASTAASQTPRFDVVSVKECRSGEQAPPSISSPGTLSLGCRPLWRLLSEAYDTYASGAVDPRKTLAAQSLEGMPAWANDARYTIDAKTDVAASSAMMRGPMMQRLLEERFHAAVHRETKEGPAWLMTVVKGGSKLRPTTAESCQPFDSTTLFSPKDLEGKTPCLAFDPHRKGPLVVVDVRGITLDVFATLMHLEGKPVIDRTGLTGRFDIHLEFEFDAPKTSPGADGAASDPSPSASSLAAMRDQLGLQLEPGRGAYEVLVLDHVERPTGN